MREIGKINWPLVNIIILIIMTVIVVLLLFLPRNNYETNCFILNDESSAEDGLEPDTGVKTSTDSDVSLSDNSSSEVFEPGEYKVTSVIDGDTIHIDYNGTDRKVRLIGVDAPETVDPNKPVDCFGPESSNYLKERLEGQNVKLASDSTQSSEDKYGRLLRYVYLDSEDIGKSIIENGFGKEYTYDNSYAHQGNYKQAQYAAMASGEGIWAPDKPCYRNY